MKEKRSYEFKVSDRVTLTPNTKFRARLGPYFKSEAGEKISMASKGPFIFISHLVRGKAEFIEAYDKLGGFCVLHIEGRTKRLTPSWVNRPYKITGRALGSLDSRRRKNAGSRDSKVSRRGCKRSK